MREAGPGISVEPVGDQEDDRALAQDASRPEPVELGDAVADPGATRPVSDDFGDPVEREVDVAISQIAGDVRETRAEHKGVDPVAVVGDRMHEMQKEAAVAAHRAGDVAQDNERRRTAAPLFAYQLEEPARAKCGA